MLSYSHKLYIPVTSIVGGMTTDTDESPTIGDMRESGLNKPLFVCS